ncbi:uncharacterized protein METZ01_LOCUS328833 [marine metagenome]|uniref:Uncharacterized protein n=1 Tax=marine metagenome TaxID=408172 RepID=A0A382PRJ5_9ZZZZ
MNFSKQLLFIANRSSMRTSRLSSGLRFVSLYVEKWLGESRLGVGPLPHQSAQPYLRNSCASRPFQSHAWTKCDLR